MYIIKFSPSAVINRYKNLLVLCLQSLINIVTKGSAMVLVDEMLMPEQRECVMCIMLRCSQLAVLQKQCIYCNINFVFCMQTDRSLKQYFTDSTVNATELMEIKPAVRYSTGHCQSQIQKHMHYPTVTHFPCSDLASN